MTWVKICGITNHIDARVAVEAGADAVGFVFHEKSPRVVTAEIVREISSRLPSKVEKVGVFVHETGEAMQRVASEAGLTAIQFHTMVTGNALSLRKFRVLPARLLGDAALASWALDTANVEAVFVDSATAALPGGSGQRFDWKGSSAAIAQLNTRFKIVVAGGLNPENIHEAIATLQPWGVDVASGVESSPRQKNAEKVRDFVKAVRASQELGAGL